MMRSDARKRINTEPDSTPARFQPTPAEISEAAARVERLRVFQEAYGGKMTTYEYVVNALESLNQVVSERERA